MPADKPSDVTPHVGRFDRLAEAVSSFVARAPYFFACLFAVVLWAFSGPVFKFNETWQLIINTSTTILTFLMVALLENSTKRSDKAVQHKLNAIAEGLSKLMREQGIDGDEVDELLQAVGLERRESSTDE